MNWYRQANFPNALSEISDAMDSFNSNPYYQQQDNPNETLDIEEMNQELDIDSTLDPEIMALEDKLRQAEDEDGDGVNDVEQLINQLGVEAKTIQTIKTAKKSCSNTCGCKKIVYANAWLDTQNWNLLGITAQEKYNTNLDSFLANVRTYRDLKEELNSTKQLYDNNQITDKGVLSALVDRIIEQIGFVKDYGLRAKRMQEALNQIKRTLNYFASNPPRESVVLNEPILQNHYNTVNNLMY